MLLEIIKNKLVSVNSEEIEISEQNIRIEKNQNLDDFYDSFLLEGFKHSDSNFFPKDFKSLYRIIRNGKCIHICEKEIRIENTVEYDKKKETREVKNIFRHIKKTINITIKVDKKQKEIDIYKEKGFWHRIQEYRYDYENCYYHKNHLIKKVYCIIYNDLIEELPENDFKEIEERILQINNELDIKSLKEF